MGIAYFDDVYGLTLPQHFSASNPAKSAAVGRSDAKSERSEDGSFIEQLGGGDVRERRAFPGIVGPPAFQTQPNCSNDLAHIRRDASAASVSPNYYWMDSTSIIFNGPKLRRTIVRRCSSKDQLRITWIIGSKRARASDLLLDNGVKIQGFDAVVSSC